MTRPLRMSMRSPEDVENKSDNQMYFTAYDDRSVMSPTEIGPQLGISSLSRENHRHSEVAFTGVMPSPILNNDTQIQETELVNRQLEFHKQKEQDLNNTLDFDEEE